MSQAELNLVRELPGTAFEFSKALSKDVRFKRVDDASSDVIMSGSGYASTISLDRHGEIVEPAAFESTMQLFMQFPVLHLNHDFGGFSSSAPYGKITDYRIDEFGLWIEFEIINTPKGREVAALIEAGILKAFSIGFRIKKLEISEENGIPTRITDLELIEISIVSSPSNIDSLIEQAEGKGIEIKSLTIPQSGADNKGVGNMAPAILTKKDVDQAVEDSLTPIGEKVDNVEVRVSDVKSSHDTLARTVADIKEAAKAAKGDAAELKALVERVTGDLVAAQAAFDKDIKHIKSRKLVTSSNALSIKCSELKDVVSMTPQQVSWRYTERDAEIIQKFQRLNDDALFTDLLMEANSRTGQGTYHLQPKAERMKSLRVYGHLNEFSKAMDTAEAGAGLEWIPTSFSGELFRDVELEQVVAPQFRQIRQTSNPYKLTVFSGPSTAEKSGETTAAVSGFNTREQDFTTTAVTFDAVKARGRTQISTEATEDAVQNLIPIARENLVQSVGRAEDTCIVNGDDSGSHFDTTPTIDETYDYQTAWDGLRFACAVTSLVANCGVDMNTASEAKWNQIRGKMGKYGARTAQLVNFVSLNVELNHLLNPTEFPSFVTLEKYGPQATVMTGEFAKAFGVAVLTSEFMPDDTGTGGIRDSSGATDRGTSLTVNKTMWLRSVQRDIEVFVERDYANDVYQLYSYKRMDFQPVIVPSTTVITVAYGYNWG